MKYKTSVRKRLHYVSQQKQLLKNLQNVNEVTSNFFWSQIQTQKFKPRGRRFRNEDKIFALALYKQSGKAYKYLSQIFSLPSRNVIRQLINEIPFGCGFNPHIFDHIKQLVQKMDPLSKYCVLIFDEISLESGLQYNAKLDVVDGFVDYGGCE